MDRAGSLVATVIELSDIATARLVTLKEAVRCLNASYRERNEELARECEWLAKLLAYYEFSTGLYREKGGDLMR